MQELFFGCSGGVCQVFAQFAADPAAGCLTVNLLAGPPRSCAKVRNQCQVLFLRVRQSAKSMSSAIFTCLSAKFTDREILIQICAKFVEIYRSGKFAPKCKLNASNKFAAPGLARGLKCAYLNYTAIECGCQVLILRKLSANPAQIFSGPRSGVCKFCAIGWEFLQNLSKLKKSS